MLHSTCIEFFNNSELSMLDLYSSNLGYYSNSMYIVKRLVIKWLELSEVAPEGSLKSYFFFINNNAIFFSILVIV